MKFLEFILMLRIFKWRIKNQSVTELSRKLCNLPGNKRVVSKFLIFSLNKFRSGSYELPSKISLLPSSKFCFRYSKLWGLYSVLFCLFVLVLYCGASRKTTQLYIQSYFVYVYFVLWAWTKTAQPNDKIINDLLRQPLYN